MARSLRKMGRTGQSGLLCVIMDLMKTIFSLGANCPKGHLLTPATLLLEPSGRPRCRTCRAAYANSYYHKNKKHLKKYFKDWDSKNKKKRYEVSRKAAMKYFYNITPEQFEVMRTKQDDLCAICRRPQTPIKGNRFARKKTMHLDVDHNHATGTVRGLLCRKCNTALGLLQDSPEILLRAHYYLASDGTSTNEF